MMELNPLEATMSKLLEAIEAKDTSEIFGEPVDVNEVPDYMDVVTHPMDLSKIKLKLASGLYYTLDDMEADFDLMIRNCLAYNNRDTIFYRAGVRMRDQCAPLIRAARRELERDGLVEVHKTDDGIAQEIDEELRDVLKMSIGDEVVSKLHTLLEKAARLRHGLVRAKRTKQIRIEIAKVKKVLSKGLRNVHTDSSQSDMDTCSNKLENILSTAVATTLLPIQPDITANVPMMQQQQQLLQIHQTPPCSPLKCANNSASPSGVNRR